MFQLTQKYRASASRESFPENGAIKHWLPTKFALILRHKLQKTLNFSATKNKRGKSNGRQGQRDNQNTQK
jgi:hypothetical protein